MNLHTLRMLTFLLATALALQGCCTTPIAVVDAAYGHEHVVASRAAHIESMRVMIEDPVAGEDAVLVHRFTLQVELENRAEATWVVKKKDLDLEVCPCDGDHCPDGVEVRLGVDEKVLVSIGPRSAAALTVPIEILIKAPHTLRALERFPIDIRLTDGKHELLHRRIGIGVFNQAGQGARLAAVFTGALLVLSVL